jgi:hypothetical protein
MRHSRRPGAPAFEDAVRRTQVPPKLSSTCLSSSATHPGQVPAPAK